MKKRRIYCENNFEVVLGVGLLLSVLGWIISLIFWRINLTATLYEAQLTFSGLVVAFASGLGIYKFVKPEEKIRFDQGNLVKVQAKEKFYNSLDSEIAVNFYHKAEIQAKKQGENVIVVALCPRVNQDTNMVKAYQYKIKDFNRYFTLDKVNA